MDVQALSESVLDVLEELDRCIAPYGLYALRDVLLLPNPKASLGDFLNLKQRHPELQSAHWFASELANVSHWDWVKGADFHTMSRDFGEIDLKMVRISKVKVRKFGSSYRVDKHESFPTRWDELRLDKEISRLWTYAKYGRQERRVRMLLFVGFDQAERPFEREFSQLNPHLNRESHGVTFVSRQWEDRYERRFFVRTAVWAYPIPEN